MCTAGSCTHVSRGLHWGYAKRAPLTDEDLHRGLSSRIGGGGGTLVVLPLKQACDLPRLILSAGKP